MLSKRYFAIMLLLFFSLAYADPLPTPPATPSPLTTSDNTSPAPVGVTPAQPQASESNKSVPSSTVRTATPEKLTQQSAAPAKSNMLLSKDFHALLDDSQQNPAFMLRIGAGLIVLALLMLVFLLWPKSQKKKPNIDSTEADSEKTDVFHTAVEEEDEMAPEYDFMGTEASIPTRLDLARGYLEMGKYVEARAALMPVLNKGNEAQKEEARVLLEKINQLDVHL